MFVSKATPSRVSRFNAYSQPSPMMAARNGSMTMAVAIRQASAIRRSKPSCAQISNCRSRGTKALR
ncbi:hypothetical protein RHECNPAF_1260017 [Rhizobium etli CNPAF512]|nr:hypothetical protein RHECNPAF_1260017 [Rhizobium etli CNPAF512]